MSRVWNHCTHRARMRSTFFSILSFSSQMCCELHGFFLSTSTPFSYLLMSSRSPPWIRFSSLVTCFEELLHYCGSCPFQFLAGLFCVFLAAAIARHCEQLDPCPFPRQPGIVNLLLSLSAGTLSLVASLTFWSHICRSRQQHLGKTTKLAMSVALAPVVKGPSLSKITHSTFLRSFGSP